MYGVRTFGTKILVVILVCPYFGEFVKRGSTVDNNSNPVMFMQESATFSL